MPIIFVQIREIEKQCTEILPKIDNREEMEWNALSVSVFTDPCFVVGYHRQKTLQLHKHTNW